MNWIQRLRNIVIGQLTRENTKMENLQSLVNSEIFHDWILELDSQLREYNKKIVYTWKKTYIQIFAERINSLNERKIFLLVDKEGSIYYPNKPPIKVNGFNIGDPIKLVQVQPWMNSRNEAVELINKMKWILIPDF